MNLRLFTPLVRRTHKAPRWRGVIAVWIGPVAVGLGAGTTSAADLKVMTTGLGSGTVTSTPAGINCGGDCDGAFAEGATITLTAAEAPGSMFVRWEGDGASMSASTTIVMSGARSVRAVFEPTTAIPTIIDFTPAGLQAYLTANPYVNTPGRFVRALPEEFKRNWLLMTRSESLQTGTAQYPRVLLPSANGRFVFTIGLSTHASYPGSHPNAIEYMQWDAGEKNFRFHEIVLDSIPAIGVFPARSRSVAIDDAKCSRCHSTQNVLNTSPYPGTTGIPVGIVKAKNKPNWDTYDSWGGLLAFNRDRIYQGTVEAAAFRSIMNPWTWRNDRAIREIIEQLELQPPGVPDNHVITRTVGGPNDGHVNFAFDASSPVLTEPAPSGSGTITTGYSFDGMAGSGPSTNVTQGGLFVTLHHSSIPLSDEGRGVRLFDALGGLAGNLNRERIADELISHRFATGSVPIDVRPVALAIAKGLITVNAASDTPTSTPGLTVDFAFFNQRNGMTINQLVTDTRARSEILPRRKADIQKLNLDRSGDIYLLSFVPGGAANGLIQQHGAATSFGAADTSMDRIRQEVFRRPTAGFSPDATVMGGIYVDRELYSQNTTKMALFRYFLEPLGVSVDKWSMGVRGRSRTYTFADVFGSYIDHFIGELRDSLLTNPVPGLSNPDNNTQLIAAVNSTLGSLPPVNAVPTFTDIQRIFNKSCIECHGGLGYPPYQNYGSFFDLSEDESPPSMSPPLPSPRLARSYSRAISFVTTDPAMSYLFQRITDTSEACPTGLMPCGGPALTQTDIETIRRWIVGPPSAPFTIGDPHLKTVDGVSYDFQAWGEFTLLRDEFLEIQARQTGFSTEIALGPNPHTGLTSCVSINTAIALRVGSERVTLQPDLRGEPSPNGLDLRVNGKIAKLDKRGLPLVGGGRIMPTSAPGGIQVEAPGGTVIVVTPGWWAHYEVWYLNIEIREPRATQGLMGTIAPGNWLPALPDGSQLGPRPSDLGRRFEQLYLKFGNAWRVTETTSLFDYAPGTSTKTFTVEDWPGGKPPCVAPKMPGGGAHKPPPKPLTREEAEKCCAEILDKERRANCVQDVMVTGDCGFGRTYFVADQIARNNVPKPPALVLPANNAVVGALVDFTWNPAKDEDGDEVTYRHYVWPVSEAPDNNKAAPVANAAGKAVAKQVLTALAKLETGKAYYWKIIAEDGKGGTVESETRRFEVK